MSSRQMPDVPDAPISYQQLHGVLHARKNTKVLKAAKRVVAEVYALAQAELARKSNPERATEAKIIDFGDQEGKIVAFLETLRGMMQSPDLISFPEYTVQCRKLEAWISLYLAEHPELSGLAAASLSSIRTALAAPAEAPTGAPAKPEKKKPAKTPRGGFVMDGGDETDGADDEYAYA